MKLRSQSHRSGIALIMVLMVITVLGVIAFGFAKSMAVEVKLARNASFDTETEWLGRSGVEFARYILGQHMTVPNEGNYDALNQKWAGGPMGTNDILAALSLENNQVGSGTFSIKIIDLERYYNINLADDVALKLAMEVAGLDPTLASEAVDCILDWRDTDDATMLNGAESDYYLSQSPPYSPKNGPIDDLDELLRIKGITPELYYGPGSNVVETPYNRNLGVRPDNVVIVGLKDLFTPISARVININTAPANVLRLIPGIDEATAQSIITTRSGLDGAEGTEDDTPFRNVGELASVPGFSAQGISNLGRILSTRSVTFRVTVTVSINNKQREMVAILRRNDQRDVKVLMQYWK
ncbi:MAG TPA: helix-hairpin-helix domain-containing protein [Verrucomicrobiae bacterium]